MALPKRARKPRLPKAPRELVPLTQDWADAIHTLMSAAAIADELLGATDIRMMCLCEARRILRRGEPEPTQSGALLS